MPARCHDCQTTFLLGPDGDTQAAACPNCGGTRLERDQPGGVNSDGDLRDMVDSFTGLDQGGNPLGEGTIMGRDGERPFGVRDNSFVGKVAFDMDFDFSERQPTHKFIIDQTGQVHSQPNPITHEEIADQRKLHQHGFPKGMSLGELYDDNSTDWYQHESGHSPNAMASMLYGHFGTPISIDPQLKPTTNEERWGLIPQQGPKRELDTLYGPAKPRSWGVPQDNEGLVRGGSMREATLNMEPYDPWWVVTAELEEPQQALPQHKAMVVPGPGGVHNGPLKWLQFLDAHVNGMPARTHNREIFAQHGNPRLPEYQQPVEVAVHHPEHLEAAIEQIEQAASIPTPKMREVGIGVANGTHPAPPGIDPSTIRTGSTHVAGPALALLPEGLGAALGIGGAGAAAGAAGGAEAGGMAALMGGGMGGGGVGGALMQGALRGIGFHGVGGLMGGGQQGQPGQVPGQPQQGLPGDPNVASVHQADLETPHSTPALHDNPDGDNHEFEDQSTDTAFQNPNVDAEAGGSAVGEEGHPTVGPNSGALERMQLLAPLLLHYYHSEDSAINDPMVRELHHALEAEDPGYLDRVNDDDHNGFKQLLEKSREPSAITAALPPAGNIPPMPATGPTPMGPAAQGFAQGLNPAPGPAVGPTQQNQCPFCGGVTTADGSCPQCGAKTNAQGGAMPPQPPTQGITPLGANHQGPVTPEQQAAVAQLLIDQGRQDEIPNMIQSPADYGKEMGEVGHRHNVAPNVDPSQQPPPQPVQEVAPPGATMPMPGPVPPQMMAAAVKKMAADSIARRCPNCNSATTGILNAKGDCHCHACGNIWKADEAVMDSEGSPMKTSAEGTSFHPNGTHACVNCGQALVRAGSAYRAIDGKGGDFSSKECPNCGVRLDGATAPRQTYNDSRQAAPLEGDPNVGTLPAAEHVEREDEGDLQDSSHTWQTQDGEPLQKGHEYEMHSKGYAIPDMVRIEQVKPDGIVVTTIGEYSNEAGGPEMGYQHEISHEEAQMEGLTFIPSNGQQEQTAPPGQENGTEFAQDVTSQPPVNTQRPMSHVTAAPEFYPETGGLDPTFQADRANAEEFNNDGDFRIGDKWYDGTDGDLIPHEASGPEEDVCPNCGDMHITSSMSSPETIYHECYRCGKTWETRDHDEGSDHEAAKRSWVLDDGPEGDDFFANYDRIRGMSEMKGQKSRDLGSIAHRDPIRQEMDRRLAASGQEREARLAGKKFSPREQREFIDEDGVARNADKLDLMGTHYEAHRYLGDKVNGDNVPDAHTFLLGL